jgi:preprotein translocase subunit SecG
MNKIEFRRNHTVSGTGSGINRRAIVMVFFFFVFILGMLYLSGNLNMSDNNKAVSLHVYFHHNNQIIIQKDTTNYDNYASVLKRNIAKLNKDRIQIKLYLPPGMKVKEMSVIFQISNAL